MSRVNIDPTKWTAYGGTWSVVSDVQQDGTAGLVAQGVTTDKQLLKSSFTGTDYILEGWGRQISGSVWGFGIRTTNAQNTYSLNVYEIMIRKKIYISTDGKVLLQLLSGGRL